MQGCRGLKVRPTGTIGLCEFGSPTLDQCAFLHSVALTECSHRSNNSISTPHHHHTTTTTTTTTTSTTTTSTTSNNNNHNDSNTNKLL